MVDENGEVRGEFYRTKPNVEVERLERVLGLDFGPVKPKKMEVNTVNQLVAFFSDKGVFGRLHFLSSRKKKKEYYGMYLPEIDTVVTTRESGLYRPLTLLHENIHAWIARVSGDKDYVNGTTRNKVLSIARLRAEKSDLTQMAEVERFLIWDMVMEGICYYGSINAMVMGETSDMETKKAAVEFHNMLVGKEGLEDATLLLLPPSPDVVTDLMNTSDKLVVGRTAAKDAGNYLNLVQYNLGEKLDMIGYAAVLRWMEMKKNEGKSIKQGLEELVASPPRNLGELRKMIRPV